MQLTRPSYNSTLATFPREILKTEDFSDEAKHCLKRLQLQNEIRFGKGNESELQHLGPMLVDPRTHANAQNIASSILVYKEGVKRIKRKHREVFAARKAANTSQIQNDVLSPAASHNSDSIDKENDSDDDDFIVRGPDTGEYDGLHAMYAEADDLFDQWMKHRVDWFKVTPIPESKMSKEVMEKAKLRKGFKVLQLYHYFCPLAWWKSAGQHLFPSIALLARIVLCKSEHGAFQEFVFSSGKSAMTCKQTCMDPDLFSKRTVLYHNRDFIKKHQQK